MVDIIPRSEWGALSPSSPFNKQTTPAEAYLHHTVGSGVDFDRDGDPGDDYMRQMQKQHQGYGWKDIAYNFVVDPRTLKVYEGRGGLVIPGAQKGHNRGTVAVAVMGDYRYEPITEALLNLLANLLDHLYMNGWAPKYWTGGHRDAPNQSTTCPGDLANYIDEINGRIDLDYRGIQNVPDAPWARKVVDWGIDSGVIITDDDHPDDWEDNDVTMGRLWTLLYRGREQ